MNFFFWGKNSFLFRLTHPTNLMRDMIMSVRTLHSIDTRIQSRLDNIKALTTLDDPLLAHFFSRALKNVSKRSSGSVFYTRNLQCRSISRYQATHSFYLCKWSIHCPRLRSARICCIATWQWICTLHWLFYHRFSLWSRCQYVCYTLHDLFVSITPFPFSFLR